MLGIRQLEPDVLAGHGGGSTWEFTGWVVMGSVKKEDERMG